VADDEESDAVDRGLIKTIGSAPPGLEHCGQITILISHAESSEFALALRRLSRLRCEDGNMEMKPDGPTM
jgi:hypothetical protein